MRLSWLVSALVCMPIAVAAQTLPSPIVLTSASQRAATTLDGPWHYIVDPYRSGWGAWPNEPMLPSPKGYLNDKPMDVHGPVQEYDWAKEPVIAVPGDWNSQKPELLFYEGLLWYQRTVTFHAQPGMRTFLHFGAAAYRANIAVNGQNLCEHRGAFTSFDCDATAALKDGENSIVIGVDNMRVRDRVPTTKTDWWNYGGLTGEVSLVQTPTVYIDDASVVLERGDGDHITGHAHVEGAANATAVTLRIPELQVEAHAKTDADGTVLFAVKPQGLERWSPEHPHLYKVQWQVEGTRHTGDGGHAQPGDHLDDMVGFKTIEVRGDEILLNGKPIFLKGVSMHAEAPRSYPDYPSSQSGRAWSDADAKLVLGEAKDLGCNFVRMAHYPYPEPFLREADRMGLLVWEEIPVYWSIDWKDPAALASAKLQLHEMMRRDQDRASIGLWSMSNETPASPERTEFIRQLIAQARQDDPSRLITSAIVTSMKKDAQGQSTATLDDPLTQYLDVLGYNEYVGWYGGKSDDAPAIAWSNPTGKPLIMSEFGGGAPFGRHGAVDERWTEEFQAHLFEKQFEMLDKIPFLRGMSPWVLTDFRSPTRQLPGVQDGYNRKGLMSIRGEKKQAFAVVKKEYEGTALKAEGSAKP